MDTQLLMHLGFLNDAAHLLRTSAPETSAYLMSHHANLVSASGTDVTDAHRQHVCNACGHIMIPGQGSELKLEAAARRPHQRRKPGRRTAEDGSGKTAPAATILPAQRCAPRKIITCGLCHEATIIKLLTPPAASRRKARGRGSKPDPVSTRALEPPASATTVKAAANASSKKRAKNRKAGLQALLSQSTQGSRSLSLADLARK